MNLIHRLYALTPQLLGGVNVFMSLGIIALVVFLNAIWHPFVHDEIVFILQNPQIGRLDLMADAFSHASLVAGAASNAYYRPLLEVFYRLEYAVFGFWAPGYHLVNVVIHIANGCLLFAVLSRLNFGRGVAYAISLFFLIHPVQTEAVACVAGISNLLSTLFVLSTLYLYLKDKYMPAVLCLSAALLSKEQTVVTPVLIVCIDLFRGKRNWLWWFILFGLALSFMALRTSLTGSNLLSDISASTGELRLRLLSIPRTLVMYLRLIAAPVDLHYYRNTDILAANAWGFGVLGILSTLLAVFVYKARSNKRAILLGLGWFLILLLPVLNIVPLVNEYSFILTAEHFLYAPIVGIFIILGVIAERLCTRRLLTLLVWIAAIILGVLSVYQNHVWRGEVPLFERMVRYEPGFGRGHLLLAKAYQSEGNIEGALEHYNTALSIMQGYQAKSANPNATRFYNGFIRDIYFYKGQALVADGKTEEALEAYRSALATAPNDAILLEYIGLLYMQGKDWDKAISYFNQALAVTPRNAGLLNNIAICYLQQEDRAQAEQFFKMALGIDPSFHDARQNLNKLITAQ